MYLSRLFNNQCINRGIKNDFYPVGAAASYSLKYLLFRILEENRVDTIVEFGSGQSTLLMDRIKAPTTRHICYEHNQAWFNYLKPKLLSCEYRLSELQACNLDGIQFEFYKNVEVCDFDLLLVDGPVGVERYSRFGCTEIIAKSSTKEFVIVFDDSERCGSKKRLNT